jgi:hypothetical protein
MKIVLSVVLALVLTTGQAWAWETESTIESFTPSWLTLNKDAPISVFINDQVSDGCWTNSKAIKNAVELELTRSNYTVVESTTSFWYKMAILGIGSEVEDDFCAISWRFYIKRFAIIRHEFDDHQLDETIPLIIWEQSGILWNDKSKTNQIMKQAFVESVQSFLVEVPKAQRAALKKVLESEDTSSKARAYWSNYKID